MNETVAFFNLILGTGGVLMLMVAAYLFVDLYFLRSKEIPRVINRWGLWIGAVLAVGAMVMALIYSEVFGFTPCGLCWLMRIFVFSQAFILVTAALRRDTAIAIYGLVLSIPGVILGLYQHYLQMGGSELINCPAASGGDCAKRILFEYGFMTFPLMGASMMLLLITIYIYLLRSQRS